MNVGLIFGIIFAAIVIGFLLMFGMGSVTDLFNISGNAQLGQQVVNLQSKVESTFNLAYGSVQEFKFVLPPGVKKICFVDPDNPFSNPDGSWESNKFLDTYISRYSYNLLVFKGDDLPEGYVIKKLKPNQNFCMTKTRKITLKNLGSVVEVTLPEF